MSLSTCEKCGGHIPLGPDATNRCEVCGLGLFDAHTDPFPMGSIGDYMLQIRTERDRLRAELKTWQDGCACTDKSKADVLALRARVAELEALLPSALKAKLESAEARVAELEGILTNDDGPHENGFKFCPYCGKPLEAVHAPD